MDHTSKTSRKLIKVPSTSFLQYGVTPSSDENNGRLSFISTGRLQKIKSSSSLERLSCLSQKDLSANADYENYKIDYSTYLLRKLQSRILTQNKKVKEDSLKHCFVSLKWEFEELLQKYVNLTKSISYIKMDLDVIRQSNTKIEMGKKVLSALKENEFDILLQKLSRCLEYSTSQLQLIGITKDELDNAFKNNILGTGSQIDEYIKKINDHAMKNKENISQIAKELTEIEKLCVENLALRERYLSTFQAISNEITETNYKLFAETVSNAYKKREESGKSGFELDDETFANIQEFMQPGLKSFNTQSIQSPHFSILGSPKNASTPHFVQK